MTRKGACRKGIHRFAPPADAGAGIRRRICEACGAVTIEATGEWGVAAGSSAALFSLFGRASMFAGDDVRASDLHRPATFGQPRR